MGVRRSVLGMITVRITTASFADLFNSLNDHGISFSNIMQQDDLSVVGQICRKDAKRLKTLLHSRGEEMKVLKTYGLHWSIAGLKRRPILLLGCMLLIFLTLYLPTRVLFVSVEGNSKIPDRQILTTANNCGIEFWASRREVRSEAIKNRLLAEIPQLQWAGVNTYGCTAVISVKEKADADPTENKCGVSSIIAGCDGIIRQVTVTQGNVLCKVGQAVKKGQLLVSGYTDCGLSIKAEAAEAEILALTSHDLELVTPALYDQRTTYRNTQTRYSLKIGKKVIKLFKGSGISDSSCVKMYKEIYITLPGGFQLPLALIEEQITCCDTQQMLAGSDTDFGWTQAYASSYLTEHMLAGRIISDATSQQLQDEILYQYGVYVCEEMIGEKRSEEILTGNGKRN